MTSKLSQKSCWKSSNRSNLYQNDIVLSSHQTKAFLDEMEVKYYGKCVIPTRFRRKRQMETNLNKLWPSNVISFRIDENIRKETTIYINTTI